MAEKNLQLTGLIHGQFNSEASFAERIGWPRQKLHRILLGSQKPSLIDVRDFADGLGVPFMLVANIFLQMESTN